MNLGLTTSFIIAGILLLSILSMNMNLSQSSTELTMRQITQQRASTIAEILQNDIPNIGTDENDAVSSPIIVADEKIIEFESNIDNSGGIETIRWEFTTTDVSGTKNPDDKILVRTVGTTSTEFKSGVTNLEFTFRDQSFNIIPTPVGTQGDRDNIRHIEITFTVQSKEQVGGAGGSSPHYIETIWKKQFTPINLRL